MTKAKQATEGKQRAARGVSSAVLASSDGQTISAT